MINVLRLAAFMTAAALPGSGGPVSASSGAQLPVRRTGSCLTVPSGVPSCNRTDYVVEKKEGRGSAKSRDFDTDPKISSQESVGSVVPDYKYYLNKDELRAKKFQDLMILLNSKLACLLENAESRGYNHDQRLNHFYVCPQNKRLFLDFLNQTQSNPLIDVIEDFFKNNDGLGQNKAEVIADFINALEELKRHVDNSFDACQDNHIDNLDSTCNYPGKFFAVSQWVPEFFIEILNNYLVSIGSEPVQPTNGTNATVNEIGVNETIKGDGVGDQSGIDLLPILLPVFAGLSAMGTSATLARCRFMIATLPNTNPGTDLEANPENPPTLELKEMLRLIAGPTGSFVREQILPTGAAVVYYALSLFLSLFDSIKEDDISKINPSIGGTIGGAGLLLLILYCCCRCKPEISSCSERTKTETDFQKSIRQKGVLTKDDEAISDAFDNSNKFTHLESLLDKLNEGNLDPVYVQIKKFLNQLAGIKGAELSFEQRRDVQRVLLGIFQRIDPKRSSDVRSFEFSNSSHWGSILNDLNSAVESSSLKTDSYLIMDAINVLTKLAVLGFNSVSGQPLQYRMGAWFGSMLFDAITYVYEHLWKDSPTKELLAYGKLVDRILYLDSRLFLVSTPPQSSPSVHSAASREASDDGASDVRQPGQRGQSSAASGQASDGASDARQPGQKGQSSAASGQASDGASDASPPLGQGHLSPPPAPVEPDAALSSHRHASRREDYEIEMAGIEPAA